MASITLTFSAAHATRIQDALTEILDSQDQNGDPRPATIDEFKGYLVNEIRQFVVDHERLVERRAAENAAPDFVDIT
jgi:hypothetical protein